MIGRNQKKKSPSLSKLLQYHAKLRGLQSESSSDGVVRGLGPLYPLGEEVTPYYYLLCVKPPPPFQWIEHTNREPCPYLLCVNRRLLSQEDQEHFLVLFCFCFVFVFCFFKKESNKVFELKKEKKEGKRRKKKGKKRKKKKKEGK